jgi:hypothetical protein
MANESKLTLSQETELKFLMEEYAQAFSNLVESSPSLVNEASFETNEAQKAVVEFVKSLIK